jgi:hypothetical protein
LVLVFIPETGGDSSHCACEWINTWGGSNEHCEFGFSEPSCTSSLGVTLRLLRIKTCSRASGTLYSSVSGQLRVCDSSSVYLTSSFASLAISSSILHSPFTPFILNQVYGELTTVQLNSLTVKFTTRHPSPPHLILT